jgi:hypothetical protein
MFRHKWPSSGVQVVAFQDSALTVEKEIRRKTRMGKRKRR